MKKVAVSLVLLAVLAGCSAGAARPATARPTPTTSSPKPPPGPISRANAKNTYLKIVNVSNNAGFAYDRALATNRRAVIQAAASRYLAALRQSNHLLLTTRWPTDVVGPTRSLAEASGSDVPYLSAIIAAKTRSAFDAAMAAYDAHETGGGRYAELIRNLLGLPAAPTG